MSRGFRSKTGCFTCRIRKKKCDEQKPVCDTCQSRGIVCYGYGRKPDWMEGMRNWKEIMQSNKARLIRESADRNFRAKRAILSNKTTGDCDSEPSVVRRKEVFWQKTMTPATFGRQKSSAASSAVKILRRDLPFIHGPQNEENTDAEYVTDSSTVISALCDVSTMIPSSPGVIWWDAGLESTHLSLRAHGRLLHIFLNILFPLQYSFYDLPDSCGRQSNRNWFVNALYSTESFYDVLLSFTISFQMSRQSTNSHLIAVGKRGELRPDARALQIRALRGLQQLVDQIGRFDEGDEVDLLRKSTRALAIILQLVGIELFSFVNGNWELHHKASHTILAMLQQRGIIHKRLVDPDGRSDQLVADEVKALDFYSACFTWVDILSNATYGSPTILAGGAGSGQTFDYADLVRNSYINPIRLMGCSNKIMAMIADITVLERLRGQVTARADKNGLQDASTLVLRANSLEKDLQQCIWTLRGQLEAGIITGLAADSAMVSIIFAYGALIYLRTMILSGALSCSYILEEYVTQCLERFEKLETRMLLRVCWPLTIAASMAPLDHYARWRLVLLRPEKEKKPLGMVEQGMRIAEKCWQLRYQHPGSTWTWRDALDTMGPRILLV